MTVKCPKCGRPFQNLRAATQHLFSSEQDGHREFTDYDDAEAEVARAHYGAPNGDNSTVDPNPQAEARKELEDIRNAREDSGVTNTADTGSTDPPEPPEPDIDDHPTCPECGGPGEPVGKLVRRWPDQLQTPPVEAFTHFCPDCTTADPDGAQIEVWDNE